MLKLDKCCVDSDVLAHASLHLELLSLSVKDLSVRDASLVGLLKVLKLLGCCLPQLQGLQALLNTRA